MIRRRRVELGLLVMAAVITGGAYVLGALGRTASMPANIGPFLGVVFALFVVAHVAVRRLAPGADAVLLPVALLLNGLGYVFIARLDEDLAGLQATWTAVGIGAFVATLLLVRRVRDLQSLQWTCAALGLLLLLLPLLPGIGRSINGARIWVSLGPVNFQPGEFAKILLAIFFAAYLVERRELLAMNTWKVGPLWLPEPRHLAPVALAWGFSLVIMISQRDLGSSLLFFALFIVLLWIGTERLSYLLISALLFAGGALFSYSQFTHVQERVEAWLDPWSDPLGNGYQIIQATFAFAWGGLTGTGIGLGSPGSIPVAETDFIFAVIGEELGLFGTTAILAAFLVLVGTGLRVGLRAEGPFEKLLATGLTAIIGIQTLIIMGGVTRLVPLTGVTLPFVSYGGSSLVANYVLLALLIRLADDAAQRAGEVPERLTRRQRRAARVSRKAVVGA